MPENLLLAVDWSNIVVRHWSMPFGDLHDRAGRPLHGAFGATRQLLRLVAEYNPSHLLVARDGPRADLLRRRIDPAYKIDRPDGDDDLGHQFEVSATALSWLAVPMLAHPGYEADDVLASAATRFPGPVVIVSGDKDLLALCSTRVHVHLLRPGGHVTVDADTCPAHFGVAADEILAYKALCGDTSDGIRGVDGIGAKTAQRVIAACGGRDWEVMWARIEAGPVDGVAEHMRRRLLAGREDADRSLLLARMHTDLPVDLDRLVRPSEWPEVAEQLADLGLGGLARHAGQAVVDVPEALPDAWDFPPSR